jgi:uncharacterized protein (UPF0210 family)
MLCRSVPAVADRAQRGNAGRVLTRGLAILLSLTAAAVAAAANPPVRTVTAFVELDPAHYEAQLQQTAVGLKQAQKLFEQAGFQVQTLRVTTQPFMQYVGRLSQAEALKRLNRIESWAKSQQILVNIGPAVLDDEPDPEALAILEALHGGGSGLNASMIIAGEDGIHWHTVRAAAHHVWRVAAMSPHSQGTFSFAAIAFLGQGSPFFPGSWHQGNGGRFSVGLQSANVVTQVFEHSHGDAPRAIAELARVLTGYSRQVQSVAQQIEAQTGWHYWGFDPTPAPLKDDSIGTALETFQPGRVGTPGTLTAAYVITEAQKQVPGRIGYAGLMVPVLEDARLAQRWGEGVLSIDTLLSYSSVCGTGLDTVPLPGEVTEEQLRRIISDVAVLAYKWKKPLTARLQPVHGRTAGQMSEFDSPFIVNTKLQPLD